MTFLKVLSSRILATDEISEIIDLIKAPMKGRSFSKQTNLNKSLPIP